MATPAQFAANQANAHSSTGPRTEEGKAASSKNSWRHGLSGRDVVLLQGEHEEFEEMKAQLESEVKPAGPLEAEILATSSTPHGTFVALAASKPTSTPRPAATPSATPITSKKPSGSTATTHAPSARSTSR